MVKSKKITSRFYIFIIAAAPFLFFVFFLCNPEILATKNNDLGRTYIPMISFIKESIVREKTIPLWRPEQMMGEPLIGNALFPIMYPINIIFIFLPTSFAAVVYYLIHFAIAGISTYYLAKSFFLKNSSALAAAFFYAFSTKMILHMSAGHITMIAAFSYFPFAFLSIRRLLQSSTYIWIITGAVSLSLILMLYPTIFYYSLLFLLLYILYYFWQHPVKKAAIFTKRLLLVIFAIFTSLGLSGVHLVPQLEFGPLSTRSQLKLEEVALPIWNLKRFLISVLFPYLDFRNLNHEEFLYLGIVPTLLALMGFFYLLKQKKIFLLIIGVLTLFFIAGLSTPLFPFVYDYLPYLKYSRVTTRIWFVVALIFALLASAALDKIKNKTIVFSLLIIFIAETFFIGYKKIIDVENLSFTNEALYQFFANDNELFRVYCTTYCFNPQLISKYNIEVLHGETPIQDKKFVDFLQAAGSYSYDGFAVIYPPYQVWQTNDPPTPNPVLLGNANVKYVASTYDLHAEAFEFVKGFENINVYKNKFFMPRAYIKNSQSKAVIQKYSPNHIIVQLADSSTDRNLVLSEKFFPGWHAFANNQELNIDIEAQIFRKILVPASANKVELIYNPHSFKVGTLFTLATIMILLLATHIIKGKING